MTIPDKNLTREPMTRDDLLALRKELIETVTQCRSLGDYDANAPFIRLSLEASLALVEHALEQMRPKK